MDNKDSIDPTDDQEGSAVTPPPRSNQGSTMPSTEPEPAPEPEPEPEPVSDGSAADIQEDFPGATAPDIYVPPTQGSDIEVAGAEDMESEESVDKMTDMASVGLKVVSTMNKDRTRSDELASQYDTSDNVSYRRSLVNDAGKSFPVTDTASGRTMMAVPAALKFLQPITKTSPSHSPILSPQESAISILDDDKFSQTWNESILKVFPNSGSDASDSFKGNDEIRATARMTGQMWRSIFRRIIVLCTDPVNAYRLSRPLQLQIDYVSPLEAHLIGEVIEALDAVAMKSEGAKAKLNKALVEALKNRNVGRSLVQSSGPFNVFWHAYFQISHIRAFMIASEISKVSFPPPSENFLSARGHALNSILRQVLGPGRWFTRLVTEGREEFVVDDDNAIGQNLAAETNGFELAMRNQYGNYFGRQRINEFRAANRLPTDESVVRTFTTQPGSTLINNGVVHVLRAVAQHWESILANPYGVFGNQRMEMLDVHLMLRFHIPVVLLTLANLRGLNSWDSQTLGPLVKDLMNLGTGTDMTDALDLIGRVEGVVQGVCGGVSSRSLPFQRWLSQMRIAADKIMEVKAKIKDIVSSVSTGIEAGYNLAKNNEWIVPSDTMMLESILTHIKLDIAKKAYHKAGRCDDDDDEEEQAEKSPCSQKQIEELGKMTLAEMEPIIVIVASKGALSAEVKQLKSEITRILGFQGCCQPLSDMIETAQIDDYTKKNLHAIHRRLLEAIVVFIEADLKEREANGLSDDMCKRALEFVTPRDKRTLIELVMKGLEESRPARLLHGRAKTLLRRELRRAKLDEQIARLSSSRKSDDIIPLAESIVRAQKAFMTIELDCTRMFAYSAFMEFEDLRTDLRKLQAVSQIQCRALDEARMNRLLAIRDSYPAHVDSNDLEVGKEYFVEDRPYKYKLIKFDGGNRPEGKIYKVPPQNMLVVGGGPSGLLTTLHCLENCLKTGGSMKLYEARDAFEKAGGTYERAQVVRLDSRWVRMLRYHLGTSYEDVWIPAYGETDSHLGNTLPTQGFIEITIKDLENVLHLEISRLWSLNLIELYSKSSAEFDYKENVMMKRGEALKVHDLVKRRVDRDGKQSDEYHSWEVVELQLHERLAPTQVRQGDFYYLYGREYSYGGLKRFQLVGTDIEDPKNPVYKFHNKDQNITTQVRANRFPAVYPMAQHGFKTIVLQCIEKNKMGVYERHYVDFNKAKKERFVMDVGQTNIVFATGKPAGYKNHLKITPEEPYGVCCIQGLKISLNMHNFGEKRWGDGVIDDIRSQTEQNTRVVGDFTKSVSVVPIVEEMISILTDGHNRRDDYMKKFNEIKENCGEQIRISLVETVDATKWRRRRLQLRFFETGDNFYLGMEFTREYDLWKNTQIKELVGDSMAGAIARLIDRLWYEAAFEVMRGGDVYNASGSKFIPKVYLIDSSTSVQLRTMIVGDSFRIKRNNTEKYEVLIAGQQKVWIRSVEGIIMALDGDEEVLRESDLTRSPDGNIESRVAIATFPVAHVVGHRAVNLQKSQYWCTFQIGDGQASPHFMRYSGLTGAAINSMLINNYVAAGLDRTKVYESKERILALSKETNWSNEEVVRRGTGANYGVDGFLRPGFKYDQMIDYLYYKAVEISAAGYEDGIMSEIPVDAMFQTAWLKKFASALIPRGMELESSFVTALERSLSQAILKRLVMVMNDDKELKREESLLASFQAYADTYEGGNGDIKFREWDSNIEQILESDNTSDDVKKIVRRYVSRGHTMAEILEKSYDVARNEYLDSKRYSSEAENEPKSTDSLVADFAVEAQAFANGLAMSAMLATSSLAVFTFSMTVSSWLGVFLALFNIPVAFGTMTNVSRYQNRNEEFRTEYYKQKFSGLEKALFKILSPTARSEIIINPYAKQLQTRFDEFISSAQYYNAEYESIQHLYNDTDASKIEDVQNFMLQIRTHFIPIVYQKEVYLKDVLWQVHVASSEIVNLLASKSSTGHDTRCDPLIVSILNNMPLFSTRLEKSLQTGPIILGFIRKGKTMSQCVLAAPFRYWTLKTSNVLCPHLDGVSWRPLPTVIRDIRTKVNEFNLFLGNDLKKETRDLKELFHATMESALASLIYFVACGSFTFAILLTAINAFDATVKDPMKVPKPVMTLIDFTRGGSSIISILAAFYALEYFVKLLIHQRKVLKAIQALPSGINSSISKVKYIAGCQSLITLVRILAAIGSVISLISGFLHMNIDDEMEGTSISPSDEMEDTSISPFTLGQTRVGALISLGGWLFAIALSFYVNFFPLWNLEPTAGYDICIHFKSDLMRIYSDFSDSMSANHILGPKAEDRIVREYTAREFLDKTRFDSVLKADRFTTIMQTILSEDFNLSSTHPDVTA